MRLLVAENDPSLGIFLQRGFGAERYSVDLTQNGEQARSLVRENEYDLAILDLSLPKEEGVAVMRHLRISRQGMPILVLTNRSQITERAGELDMGADDFVVKPFAFSELSARVRALLKRGARSPESVLRIEDLELNRVEHSVRRGDRAIELTPKEYSLLEFLMRNAGQRVTRSQIIEHVWNYRTTQLSGLVDVQSIQADGTGLTLTTSGGAALVVGNQSFNLTTQTNPTTGFQDVFSQATDITSSITGGNLAGDIQLRDQEIPSLQSSLDTLASGLANSVNTQNAAGFDLKGNAGGNIFVPPTGVAGSAINLAVAITDPNLIAASADGTAGNNANATAPATPSRESAIPEHHLGAKSHQLLFRNRLPSRKRRIQCFCRAFRRAADYSAAAKSAERRVGRFARPRGREPRPIPERLRRGVARRKHYRVAVSNNHQHDRWLT